MLQEFGQVMLDRLKVAFGTTVKTYYSFYEPRPGKRGYPHITLSEARSNEDMLTSVHPLVEAFYLIEVVSRYMGTSQDESAAFKAHQEAMQIADSAKEILRNDSVVRGLCLDFRATATQPRIAEAGEYSELRQPLEIRATFNTNGGVYGYSIYGQATYG